MRRALQTSYHAVVYDAYPVSPTDRFFAGQFRSQPGMGLVPIVYLVEVQSHNLFNGMTDRSAVRARDEDIESLAATMKSLRADTRLGRTFIRYSTRFHGELRYGGRVFAGDVVNISRGGGMMESGDQMPTVGIEVGLSLQLPTTNTPVDVRGRVARVDLAKDGETSAKVGVEFESFASTGETDLISFLATLDKTSQDQRRQTAIGIPPIKETK